MTFRDDRRAYLRRATAAACRPEEEPPRVSPRAFTRYRAAEYPVDLKLGRTARVKREIAQQVEALKHLLEFLDAAGDFDDEPVLAWRLRQALESLTAARSDVDDLEWRLCMVLNLDRGKLHDAS